MQIIDGYCGIPNIYADDIGEYHISVYGAGDYVLAVGERLGYELVSNNEIQVKDGMFITQGRRGLIKKGNTERCIIENGTQAENRNDLIVIEYAKDETTQMESHTLKVIKGVPGETAEDPEIATGDIPGGAILHQMPLYRVKLSGLSVSAVEQMFEIGMIAPETVDPMATTEEGFAADAKLTGDAIKELNANFQGAADAIGDAISGLGVAVPEGTTLLEMADIIKSSLYKPPTSQSGTVNLKTTIKYLEPGKTFTGAVTFPKAFAQKPLIRLSGTCGKYWDSSTYTLNVSATSVSTTGFSYVITNSYSFDIDHIIFTWSANA